MIPDRDPEERPPFTRGFVLLLPLVAAYGQLLVHLGMLAAAESGGTPELSAAQRGIAAIIGYGAAFALAAPRIVPPPGAALGFLGAPRLCWLAVCALLPSILLVSEVDNLARALAPLPSDGAEAMPPALGGMSAFELATVAILVFPVIEEVFFRGLLHPRLVELWGASRGVLLGAALAGLASLLATVNPWMVPVAFGRALVLGALRESAGSVLPGLLLGVLFGLVSFLAALGAFGIPGFDDMEAAHTPLTWLAPAAVFTGVGLGLCRAAWVGRQGLGPPAVPLDRPGDET